MKIIKTKLAGAYIIEPNVFEDERGQFIKIFHKNTFIEHGLDFNFEESFYSISAKNVMRGMHFQIPPKEHTKLVYVTNGAVLDAILDIRKKSPTYGEYLSIELSATNHKLLYIPIGFAHGFLSLENDSCMTYLQTTMYNKECDSGIKIDSFGMDWGKDKKNISERDKNFPALKEFKTPFI